MIYKRVIEFENNNVIWLNNFNNFVKISDLDFVSNNNLVFEKNNKFFYWFFIDLLILYKSNNFLEYDYYIIDLFEDYIFIFEKSFLIDFIIKTINIDKNRQIYLDVFFNKISKYYLFDNNFNINVYDFDNLFKFINNWINIIKLSKSNLDINICKIEHNLYLDKHLLVFKNINLYKKNINIKIKNISKIIWEFSFLNYISHYKINNNNIDLFFLNSVNINWLNQKPLIVKGMDEKSNLSIIKWVAEWIERYSSIKLMNDNFLKTSNFQNISLFSTDFLGFFLSEINYKEERNWFPIYEIKQFTKNKISLNKNNKLYIPIDFLFSSQEYKSIYNYIWNSNWISTHSNFYDAFLNSYYEILERDSIALTYFYKLSPNRIEINDNYYKHKILDLEEKYNFNFYFFNLNYNHWINIVLCIWKNKENKIPFIFSWAGADINFIKSFNKALNEVLYLVDLSSKNNLSEIINSKKKSLLNLDIYDTKDHIYYYSLVESYKDIEFLFLNNEKIIFLDFINYKIHDICEIIKNDKIYIWNLTTDFWNKNNFFTVKIFSKKYIPFWFWKNWNLPINKLDNRFLELKKYLIKKNIFNEIIYTRFNIKEKDFLHFLW